MGIGLFAINLATGIVERFLGSKSSFLGDSVVTKTFLTKTSGELTERISTISSSLQEVSTFPALVSTC